MLMKSRVGLVRMVGAMGCAVVMAVSPAALAREDASVFVAHADHLGAAGSGTEAIEDVLFPALAAMDDAPEWMLGDQTRLVRCVPGSGDWGEVESWLMLDPQRAVLDALSECTDTSDGTKWVLGLPYGTDKVDASWVEKGLCVSLSQDDLLATADFEYLDALNVMNYLAMLEAHRLAAAGEGEASLAVLHDVVKLGRAITERPFTVESYAGYMFMSFGLSMTRDMVYSYPETFRDRQVLVEAAADLGFDDLKWTQFMFPRGDKVAAEQLMARTIRERGSVDVEAYVSTLSRASTTDRPLRRFGAAKKWREVAPMQADWFDTQDAIDKIWGDLSKRWDYSLDNSQHARATDWERLASPANEMVVRIGRKVQRVFPARRMMFGELGSTRVALASVAWKTVRFDWPAKDGTSALSPNFVSSVDLDPYNYHPRKRAYQTFRYWVPIRDERFDLREEPHPHPVLVSVDPDAPYYSAIVQAGAGGPFAGGTLTSAEDPGRGAMSTRAGGGGDALRSEMSQGRLLAEAMTSDLSAYYDPATNKIDVARYREFLDEGESEGAVDAVLGLASVAKLIDPTMTVENIDWGSMVDRVVSAVPPGLPSGGSMAGQLSEIGVDLETFKRFLVRQFEAIDSDPRGRGVLEKVVNGGTADASDEAIVRGVLIETLTSDEMISMQEQMIAQIYAGPMGESLRSAQESDAARFVAFSTMIDDSQVLIYSIGPDRYDNRAQNVGSEGDDMLYWPPVISLYREYLEGN